jgi:hypothetical protein
MDHTVWSRIHVYLKKQRDACLTADNQVVRISGTKMMRGVGSSRIDPSESEVQINFSEMSHLDQFSRTKFRKCQNFNIFYTLENV